MELNDYHVLTKQLLAPFGFHSFKAWREGQELKCYRRGIVYIAWFCETTTADFTIQQARNILLVAFDEEIKKNGI